MSGLEGFKGAGTVQLQLIIDGVRSGGLIDAGNVNSLTSEAPPEKEEIISRRRDSRGNALDTVHSATSMKITWKGNTFFKDIWDMLFLGDTTEYAGATITDEPAKAIVLDEWLPFGDAEAFPGHTMDALTDSTGTTTYVLNTDYEYRQRDGAIKYLSAGSINLNENLLGDLTAPSSGYQVKMNKKTKKTVRMLVDGINEFNERDCFLQLHQVSNAPTSGPDIVGSEAQEYEFEGTCEVPEGFDSPGYWHYTD